MRRLEEARKLNPVREETLGRLAAAYAVTDGIREDPAGTRYGAIDRRSRAARNEHAGRVLPRPGYGRPRSMPQVTDRGQILSRGGRTHAATSVALRGELGLTYMRLGEEVEARKHLDESFAMDPFNVRVSNTLKVLEVARQSMPF